VAQNTKSKIHLGKVIKIQERSEMTVLL